MGSLAEVFLDIFLGVQMRRHRWARRLFWAVLSAIVLPAVALGGPWANGR